VPRVTESPPPPKLTPEALRRLELEFREWSAALEPRTRAMEALTAADVLTRAR
jgi:hypothetical protein